MSVQSSVDALAEVADISRSDLSNLKTNDPSGLARASALADYMVHRGQGPKVVIEMMTKDISAAMRSDDWDRAGVLLGALRLFLEDHPQPKVAQPRGY